MSLKSKHLIKGQIKMLHEILDNFLNSQKFGLIRLSNKLTTQIALTDIQYKKGAIDYKELLKIMIPLGELLNDMDNIIEYIIKQGHKIPFDFVVSNIDYFIFEKKLPETIQFLKENLLNKF